MNAATFTCNSCLIQFRSSDLQRYHMKTEWHRYNLKRRVAQLAPVDAAQFAKKLQVSEMQKAENEVDEFGFPMLKSPNQGSKDKRSPKRTRKKADTSSRGRKLDIKKESMSPIRSVSPTESVSSRISKLSVLSSEATTDFGEDTVSEYGFTSESNYEIDSEDETSSLSSVGDRELEEINIKDCIFCGTKHKEIEKNLTHMFTRHGLYIPERSFLVDLPGLLRYLIETVIINKSCLCCNFKGTSIESIRAHMSSKRHCRLPYETKEERNNVSQFYDFSLMDSEVKKSGRDVTKKKIHFSDGSFDEVQDALVVEDRSSPDEDGSSQDEDANQNNDDINSNYAVVSVDSSGMELSLPNGSRVGHRSGQRYYRQNINIVSEHNESRRTVSAADRRLASGITERQFKQGLKNMQQLEKRAINQQIRREKSSKINYQAHYRDELLQ